MQQPNHEELDLEKDILEIINKLIASENLTPDITKFYDSAYFKLMLEKFNSEEQAKSFFKNLVWFGENIYPIFRENALKEIIKDGLFSDSRVAKIFRNTEISKKEFSSSLQFKFNCPSITFLSKQHIFATSLKDAFTAYIRQQEKAKTHGEKNEINILVICNKLDENNLKYISKLLENNSNTKIALYITNEESYELEATRKWLQEHKDSVVDVRSLYQNQYMIDYLFNDAPLNQEWIYTNSKIILYTSDLKWDMVAYQDQSAEVKEFVNYDIFKKHQLPQNVTHAFPIEDNIFSYQELMKIVRDGDLELDIPEDPKNPLDFSNYIKLLFLGKYDSIKEHYRAYSKDDLQHSIVCFTDARVQTTSGNVAHACHLLQLLSKMQPDLNLIWVLIGKEGVNNFRKDMVKEVIYIESLHEILGNKKLVEYLLSNNCHLLCYPCNYINHHITQSALTALSATEVNEFNANEILIQPKPQHSGVRAAFVTGFGLGAQGIFTDEAPVPNNAKKAKNCDFFSYSNISIMKTESGNFADILPFCLLAIQHKMHALTANSEPPNEIRIICRANQPQLKKLSEKLKQRYPNIYDRISKIVLNKRQTSEMPERDETYTQECTQEGKVTVILDNIFPLSEDVFDATMLQSDDFTLVSGDTTLTKALLLEKLAFYQVMGHKKYLFHHFLEECTRCFANQYFDQFKFQINRSLTKEEIHIDKKTINIYHVKSDDEQETILLQAIDQSGDLTEVTIKVANYPNQLFRASLNEKYVTQEVFDLITAQKFGQEREVNLAILGIILPNLGFSPLLQWYFTQAPNIYDESERYQILASLLNESKATMKDEAKILSTFIREYNSIEKKLLNELSKIWQESGHEPSLVRNHAIQQRDAHSFQTVYFRGKGDFATENVSDQLNSPRISL